MAPPSRLPQPPPLAPHVQWHWSTHQAQTVLASDNLGAILRFHRSVHALNQTALGDLLGYDKTTISALELGKRRMDDVPSRRWSAYARRWQPDHGNTPPRYCSPRARSTVDPVNKLRARSPATR
ncbi:helix-turn-helix transcriptional regulator [Streptomyces sp. B6B3]|uniref:helix-turn-helix transcriptional regulator n=1 Tax=Streptomyces sp. B6B3 TaxID=3153570 RepID=UPI00325EF5E3